MVFRAGFSCVTTKPYPVSTKPCQTKPYSVSTKPYHNPLSMLSNTSYKHLKGRSIHSSNTPYKHLKGQSIDPDHTPHKHPTILDRNPCEVGQ